MKRKILIVSFIFILISSIFQIKSNAMVSNNDYYVATLPGFSKLAGSDTEKSFYEQYGITKAPNSFINISIHTYKNAYRGQYTQEDLDYHLSHFSSLYLQMIKGEMTSISGFSCKRILCKRTNMGNDYSEYLDQYEVMTDRYSLSIRVETTNCDEYIDSQEERDFINSFKIKSLNYTKTDLPFTDITYSDWYYNAAKYTYTNKLISGYNDTTFAPDDKLTRAMVVTILYRMDGSPAVSGVSGFGDVISNIWYSNPIKWAVDNGIVHGYEGTNKFGPEDFILRQDLAGILRNYAAYKKKDTNVTSNLAKFSDYTSVSSYAKTSMEWAVGKGVITGNSDGTLNPKGNTTRAEAAAMITKYCINVGR